MRSWRRAPSGSARSLLTAVTTVLGLIPLTLGLNIDFFSLSFSTGGESSQFWASMGVAVIFGLTVATVLTLVVVPVTYDSLDGLSEALADWRAKRQRGVEPVEEGALHPAGT